MSNGTFLLVLTAGAGVLAMWVYARVPSLAPERLGKSILHAVAAFAILRLSTGLGDSLTAYTMVMCFVLPALVYALLCTLWVLRAAQSALGLSR